MGVKLHFETLDELEPGPGFVARFHALWPHYARWYLSEGAAHRPSYLACERALRRELPALEGLWGTLVDLVGGGDLVARFLSLYCPPAYISGCSQAVWLKGEPVLIRNYDYPAALCERLFWRTAWQGRRVLASSDCLIGVLDGINEHGVAASLSFGGRREVGVGFGAPMVLRQILQSCATTADAAEVLRSVSFHMAYNITVLDATGRYLTALTAPGETTRIRRDPVATNHQDRVRWVRHAQVSETLERERRLYELLGSRSLASPEFAEAFLTPPVYRTNFARGLGTLYTALYYPVRREVELRWPGMTKKLSMDAFEAGAWSVDVPETV